MKRLIATRRLKRTCIFCNSKIFKGNVYYKKRTIWTQEPFVASEDLTCARCKYGKEAHLKRYKEFQKRCVHPEEFIETTWSYIQGESVQEPAYDQCLLCGEIF